MDSVQNSVDKLLSNWSDERIIIVGESHISGIHHSIEEKIAEEVKPDYILSEAFKETEAGEHEPVSQLFTLRQYREHVEYKTGEDVLDDEFFDDLYDQSEKECSRYDFQDAMFGLEEAEIPQSREEMMDTPIYRMNTGILRTLRSEIHRKMGEKLEDLDESYSSIEEAVDNIELLSNLNEVKQEIDGQTEHAFDHFFHRFDHMSDIAGAEVAGADMSRKKEEQVADILTEAGAGGIERKRRLLREKHMAARIDKYASKTDGYIVAVLGDNHVERVGKKVDQNSYCLSLFSEWEPRNTNLMEDYAQNILSDY